MFKVIFCTGYTFDFSFIEYGRLINVLYNDFHLYKHIILPDLKPHYNLGIIGHIKVKKKRAKDLLFFFYILKV